jgi:hypothetical protein
MEFHIAVSFHVEADTREEAMALVEKAIPKRRPWLLSRPSFLRWYGGPGPDKS